MFRLVSATAGFAVVLALMPDVAVHAAAETCQGETVTVSGNIGTDGDDVMVTDPALGYRTDSGAGNDLICIRSLPATESHTIAVHSGAGNDTVLNEIVDDHAWVVTVLGDGSDRYTGLDRAIPDDPLATPFVETVFAGENDWYTWITGTQDVSTDWIETRGGDDVVYSGSLAEGVPNNDYVDTGTGDDEVTWAGVQTAPALDLGSGNNHLDLYPGSAGVSIDAVQRSAWASTQRLLSWTGTLLDFRVFVRGGRLTFTGTAADEQLVVAGHGSQSADIGAGERRVEMAGGDDQLFLYTVGSGSIHGGAGTDAVYSGCEKTRWQLGGASSCTRGGARYVFDVDGWEQVDVRGDDVRVRGTRGPDKIRVVGNDVAISGLGGDDVLNANTPYLLVADGSTVILGGRGDDHVDGTLFYDELYGGRGDDRLFGDSGNDTIVGGVGRDWANGQDGRDRCLAEVRRSCERR